MQCASPCHTLAWAVQGREFTWHGPSSCTKSLEVLSSPQFLGDSGPRTQFIIHLTQHQARDITKYSLECAEDEVLLPPGCRFQVAGVLTHGSLTLSSLPLGRGHGDVHCARYPSAV